VTLEGCEAAQLITAVQQQQQQLAEEYGWQCSYVMQQGFWNQPTGCISMQAPD
jgi:hypothetical protein